MLEELAVKNLGLLENARIEPGPGLVVITGETGTGKTLLAGAVGLLMGWPARSGLIGPFGTEAEVEGRFSRAGEEVVLGRRLVDGRSRAYRNGQMLTLREMADEGSGMVEMVAQHDHLTIGTESSTRLLLDRVLDGDGDQAKASYEQAWSALVDVRARALSGDVRSLERARDLAAHESNEISTAGFAIGDDDRLMSGLARLRNAVALNEHLADAHQSALESQDALGELTEQLRRAANLDDTLGYLAEDAVGVGAQLFELLNAVRLAAESIEDDPQRLADDEARLARLADLRRKYGDSLDEILAYAVAAESRAADLDREISQAATYDADLEKAQGEARAAAATLNGARQRAAELLCRRAAEHLSELGFLSPHLSVDFEESELRAHGGSKITLRFASDDRLTPGPVGKVASGGELSRLVLALRLAGGVDDAPVIVFDEIDAGVGGRTALSLGRKLHALAHERQVFVVTHLPQVAAFGDSHFVVRRSEDRAEVHRVVDEDQIDEIARMLAGLEDSEQGREYAAQLVATARKS